MSNIISIIKDGNHNISLKYYGKEDMSTQINLKSIIECYTQIKEHFNNKTHTIDTLDDYIDYLFIIQIIKYKELIPYIIESKRNDFENIIKYIEGISKNYTNSMFIKFINNSYRNVIEITDGSGSFIEFEVLELTLKLVPKFFSGIKEEVICYIVDRKSCLVYDNIELYKKYIIEKKIYLKLITKSKIKHDMKYRFDEIFEFIIYLKDINYETEAEKALTNIVEIVKSEYFNTTIERVMETQLLIFTTLNYLKRLKSPYTYEFEEELSKQNKILDQYLQEKGQKIEIPFDINPYIKLYEDKKIEAVTKIISITHSKSPINDGIIDLFNYAVNHCERSIFDQLISSNISCNDYFTISVQQNIDLFFLNSEIILLHYLLKEKSKTDEMLGISFAMLNRIIVSINIDFESTGLDFDFNILNTYIDEIFYNIQATNELKIKSQIYGASMFICGLIEKILRIINKQEIKEEQWLKDSVLVLGALLDESNEIIMQRLGFDNARCIRYYLLTDKDGRVGKNIRNNLAHLNGEFLKQTDKSLVAKLLVILIDVINSLFIYYSKT